MKSRYDVDDFNRLPPNLPVPTDDGGAAHLPGMVVPSVPLPSTTGQSVDLASLAGTTVVYAYPRTGRPDVGVPQGWNEVPGARGCTPQSCAFRDHYAELQALGAGVFGLSTQDTAYQREAVERLGLPYALLSDQELRLARALKLPTFEFEGVTLLKRLTMISQDGHIEKVFYPVFPPDRNAADVVEYLARRAAAPS